MIFFTAGKGKSLKEIAEILVMFQAAGFGCLDHAVEGGGSLGSVGVTIEPTFLSATACGMWGKRTVPVVVGGRPEPSALSERKGWKI